MKWTALGLIVAISLVAAGCGGDDDDTTAAREETAATSGSEEPTPQDVPGVSDDTIKIGATHPMSGQVGPAGQAQDAGVRLAVDEINENGGIGGRQIEYVGLDDGFEAPRHVANMRRLIDQEEVYAIVSASGGGLFGGSWPLVEERNTPVWAPVTPPDPKINQVFLLGATREIQAQVLVDYYVNELDVTKIGIIATDNDLGESTITGVNDQVPKHDGVEVVATERIEAATQDVSSAVIKALDAGAEGLILGMNNAQAVLVLRQVSDLGQDVPVSCDSGCGAIGGQNVVEPAGDAGDGFLGTFIFALPSSDLETVTRWKALAEASDYPEAGGLFSLQMYLYTVAFFDLLERMGDDLSYENFYAAAEATADDPIEVEGMPPIECGPLPDGHLCVKGAGIAQFNDGEWEILSDFVSPE